MHVTSVLHPPAAQRANFASSPSGACGVHARPLLKEKGDKKKRGAKFISNSTTPCFSPYLFDVIDKGTNVGRRRGGETLGVCCVRVGCALLGNEAQQLCITQHSHSVRTCSIEVKGSLVQKRKEHSSALLMEPQTNLSAPAFQSF